MLKLLASLLFILSANANNINTEILSQINKNLKNIESLTAQFRQDSQQQTQHGTIYFKQNEGILIKYQSQPISILLNKNTITYYDSKLNQKSQIPTKNSATKIFTQSLKISQNQFNIEEISQENEITSISLAFKNSPEEGKFKVYLSNNSLPRKIIITSPENETITIDIYSHSTKKISPNRFKAINIEKNTI